MSAFSVPREDPEAELRVAGVAAFPRATSWLAATTRTPLELPARRVRLLFRVFDTSIATVALVVFAPLMLPIYAAIRLTSRGPAVFSQRRVGRSGQSFRCYKFRTMDENAQVRLGRLLNDPDLASEWASRQKLSADPRVTHVGRLLRRTNLDELPQLINVLRGEMSLVGPRPVLDDEAERYGRDLAKVLSVKPGMTGLWQVSGRNDLPYEQRIALDLEYVETRSAWLNLQLMLRTLLALLGGSRGAY